MTPAPAVTATSVLTPDQLLGHWQGHRRLTRRVLEAFPEEHLFTYSVGNMRPFSQYILEFLDMGVPGIKGVVNREWSSLQDMSHFSKKNLPKTKQELLERWDEATTELEHYWKQIPSERFQEMDKAFGQWEGPIWYFIFYWIDNEIHHRAQGYVYLRSLGIEPPPFWER